MAERQHTGDVMRVRVADSLGQAESAFVFGGFVSEQVTFTGAVAHHFAGGGDLESFPRGFSGLGCFPTWHGVCPS